MCSDHQRNVLASTQVAGSFTLLLFYSFTLLLFYTFTSPSEVFGTVIFRLIPRPHGVPHGFVHAALYGQPSMAATYLDLSRVGVLFIAGNSTREAHESYLYQPEALLANLRSVLYDQV